MTGSGKINVAKKKVSKTNKPVKTARHIVGIGASAGGLNALEKLIESIPENDFLSFVIIQHLDPTKKSSMDSILSRRTKLKVKVAEDFEKIKTNTIYLNPPDKYVTINKGVLYLSDFDNPTFVGFAIDHFFTSLAHDQKENAIGIILSGSASDGTNGIKVIKSEGGLLLAQNPEQAKYDSMPRSAIDTGLVDFVLNSEIMVSTLIEYIKHPFVIKDHPILNPEESNGDFFNKLFAIIRSKTGNDFSKYKLTTIGRRVARRLVATKQLSYSGYLKYLQNDTHEFQKLFKDFLISVTSFFRDPEAFKILETEVIPQMIKSAKPFSNLRVWVPGCATGEEAYSIAILFAEAIEKHKANITYQIFATDLDQASINIARKGQYTVGISSNVTPNRLNRFFTNNKINFKIKNELRDCVIFAEQNVIKDPPFSRIDLLCCRNLLIYLGGELQRKAIAMFHFVLNENGILLLGPSESVGDFNKFFVPINSRWKIFKKTSTNRRRDFITPGEKLSIDQLEYQKEYIMSNPKKLKELTEKVILNNFSSPALMVNSKFEIIYFHGNTDRYLSPPSGDANFNILKMIKSSTLRNRINSTLIKVLKTNEVEVCEDIRNKYENVEYDLKLKFIPVPNMMDDKSLVVITFSEEKVSIINKKAISTKKKSDTKLSDLEYELQSTKESLQSSIDELEASNEELNSTNEELQSTNEEIQSTNEELETSKEELQSTNEELSTTNSELQNKIDELSRVNDDINNLLASTEIETIFLDKKLMIKRFTPAMKKIYNLIDSDIDRPISDITSNINYPTIYMDAKEVLDTLEKKEKEIQNIEGTWYNIRILPYRTTQNVIDGVVITFIDITPIKQARRLHQFEALINDSNDAIIIFDMKGNITLWNRGAEKMYLYKTKEALKMNYTDLFPEKFKAEVNKIVKMVKEENHLKLFETKRIKKNNKLMEVNINATLLKDDTGKVIGISATERDISSYKKVINDYEKKIALYELNK